MLLPIILDAGSTGVSPVPPADWPLEIFKAVMGLGGFAGVVLTLILTSRSARRATRKQIDDELTRREADLTVLKAAVLASLVSLDTMIDGELEYLADDSNKGTWVPLLDYFETYRRNLDKVGQLDAGQVHAVAQAYFKYQEYAGYIARKSGATAGQPMLGLFAEFQDREYAKYKGDIVIDLARISKRVKAAVAALGGTSLRDED